MREFDGSMSTAAAGGSGFIVGMVIGAAAGAALGLLFAPKTGSELRGDLAHSAERFRNRASKKYDEASGAVDQFVEKGREVYSQAMDAVDDVVERGRAAANRGREKFDEARAAAAENQY